MNLPLILKRNHIYLFLLIVLLAGKSQLGSAQKITYSDQYILYPILINPAFAGDRNALNLAGFYRQQWIGINGAPETLNLTADFSAAKGKIGLGMKYQNERFGVNNLNSLSSIYSYRIKTHDGELALGLGAGLLSNRTAWSKLNAIEVGDENFLIDSKTYWLPEFSFGIKYTYKSFLAGFSIPELLSYSFNYENNKYSFKADPSAYNYMLYVGNSFNLSPQTSLFASSLLAYSTENDLKYDLNLMAVFSEKIWVGGSYHNDKSVSGLVQFGISNQYKIGYSYQMNFGEISYASKGTHELMLRYEFRYKADVSSPLKF
jgi:type IX secretion system PorP/SprF family membrane protein